MFEWLGNINIKRPIAQLSDQTTPPVRAVFFWRKIKLPRKKLKFFTLV